MKLHLPKLLRHAVLACVAAVAGVTTTIGTATFTGGLVAVTLAGHQAWAGWDGDIYYFNNKAEDSTPTAADKGNNVSIMAGEVVEYVMNSFTMKAGQSLTIAANTQNGKNVQKLTITDLSATNANITIQADQTLALGQAVMTAANKFASIQVEGTLDLSAIGGEYQAANAANFSKNFSKITGSGTVKLAKGLWLQSSDQHNATSEDGGAITLATNYVVGGADVEDYSETTGANAGDLVLQSWANGLPKWRDWDVVSSGSLTVGDNGKGILTLLSGNRLDVCGGTATAGIIRVGYSGTADNIGAVSLSDGGKLTVGQIFVQGKHSNTAGKSDNAVSLLDGTVEFTSQYAVRYKDDASADVTLGGTGDEQLKLVAKTEWDISKESNFATSSFTVGNVLVDSANTAGITLTDATLVGSIDNQKTLTLDGTTVLYGGSTITNSGTLSLDGIFNVLDAAKLEAAPGTEVTFSDGENGYVIGNLFLLKNNGAQASVVIADDFKIQIDGVDAEYQLLTNGDILMEFTGNGGLYNVNTEVTYGAALAEVSAFKVNNGGAFYISDPSVLSRVHLAGETGQVFYTNANGDKLLSFGGDFSSPGLGFSVATDNDKMVLTGTAASTFTGDIYVQSGATLKIQAPASSAHIESAGVSYMSNKERVIVVDEGGTLDVNGTEAYYHVVLNEGAIIQNTGGTVEVGWKALPYLELQGDATVNSEAQMVMQKGGSDSNGVYELDLNGYTLTKTGTGNFELKSPAITAGTIDIQKGTLTISGGSVQEGVSFNQQSGSTLTISGGTVQEGVSFNQQSGSTLNLNGGSGYANADFCMQEGATLKVKVGNQSMNSLQVNEGASTGSAILNTEHSITINSSALIYGDFKKTGASDLILGADNSASDGVFVLAKGATVANGIMKLNGATTLGGTLVIENGATLDMSESASVTISGLAGFITEEGVVSIPETNSLVETGDTVKIVDDKNADNDHNDLSQVTYKGTQYTLTDGSIAASGKIYYAVEAGVGKEVTVGGASATARTDEATEFYVGTNGTLRIAGNASDSMDADQVLASTQGTGTMSLATSVRLDGGAATQFQGKLQIVSGGDLRLGMDGVEHAIAQKKEIDLRSLDGIELAGGTLSMRAFAGNVGSVEVTSASLVFVVDSSMNDGVKDKQIIESLDLRADLEMRAHWKTNLIVDKLTGTGNLKFTADSNDALKRDLSILSVAGYSGNIKIEERENNFANVQLTIRDGESLNATQIVTCVHSAVALSGAGLYNLGAATALDSKVTLADGWTGTVQISGANVASAVDLSSLTTSRSTLNINDLTVADGGALTLGGAVTLDGTVTLAESIANNGTLNFADDIMLDLTGMTAVAGTGGVKVITLLTGAGSSNLAGLTDAVLSEATKALGTDWTFADNTITYKENDLYWEGGTGDWSTPNWSTTDGDTANLGDFVADADAIFSGDTDCTISLTDNVSVAFMKITSGDYIFQRAEGNNAATITARGLQIAKGASATFKADSLAVGGLSTITIDGVLDVVALSSGMTTDLMKKMLKATGSGTLKVGGGYATIDDLDSLQYNVNIEADDALEILRSNGSMDWNVVKNITVKNGSGSKNGDVLVGRHVNMHVLNGGSIVADGAIKLGNSNVGTGDVGSELTLVKGGSIKAASILRGDNNSGTGTKLDTNTFVMSGGTLELTSASGVETGIATTISGGTLKATSASWGVTAAEVGGVIIKTSADNSITLTDAKLTGTIDNSAGMLKLAFSEDNSTVVLVDTAESQFATQGTNLRHSVDADNGFEVTDKVYTVVTEADNLELVAGEKTITWKVNETVGTFADGVVTIAGSSTEQTFWVGKGEQTYSTFKNATNGEGEALNTIALKAAGILVLDETLDARVVTSGIKIYGAGTIKLDTNGVLSSNQISLADGVAAGTKPTLIGSGVYDLGIPPTWNDQTLKVALGESWSGTVKIADYGNLTNTNIVSVINQLGNENSLVALSGVKGKCAGQGSNVTTNLDLLTDSADSTKAALTWYSDCNQENKFSGSVEGSGKFVWAGGTSGETLHFTGDVSGWTGELEKTAGQKLNLMFSGSTEINVTLTRQTGNVGNFAITIDDSNITTEYEAIVLNSIINPGDNLADDRTTFNVTEGTKLKIASDSVTVADLTNHGTIDVSEGALVSVTRNMSNFGAYSTAEDLSVAGWLDTHTNGSITATGKTITVGGGLKGAGSITAGALTLQAATNAVGDLELTGALTLGTAATNTTAGVVSRLTAGDMEVGALTLNDFDMPVANTTYVALIKAASLGTNMEISITEALLNSKLGQAAEKTITLLELTSAYADTLSVTLAGAGPDGYLLSSDNSTQYSLEWNDDRKKLTLTAALVGSGWVGEVDPSNPDAVDLPEWHEKTSWEGDSAPTAESMLKLTGSDEPWIYLNGTQSNVAKQLTVDTKLTYTMQSSDASVPGKLVLGDKLVINNGTLDLVGVVVQTKRDTNINGAGSTLQIKLKGTLDVDGDLANQGTLYVDSSSTVDVARDVLNEGGLTTEGTFTAADGLTNSGNVGVTGGTVTIGTTGTAADVTSLANSGTIAVSGGAVSINGSVSNTGAGIPEPAEGATKAPGLDISGGTVAINGVLTNSDAVVVTGAETSLTIGAKGTAATTDSLVNTGSLQVDEGADVTVNGSLDNTRGTIIIGTAAIADGDPDTEGDQPVAATTGTLEVTGDLTGTGGADKLVVNESSELTVGGDLSAANVALAFGGDVTVGGKATVGDLAIAETATFTADAAKITGTLANNGEITVGTYDADGNLVGDADTVLDINKLTGSGKVTVAEGGTLKITTATDFTGELKNLGAITVEEGVTISTETVQGGNITAPSLTIGGLMKDVIDPDTQQPVQEYVSANGTVLGNVATKSIIIDTLDHEAGPHLTLDSLTGKLSATDTDNTVTITLTELGSSEGVDKLIANREQDYHLLSIRGTVSMEDLSLSLEGNLSDANKQKLWKSGLKLGDLTVSSTMALRAASTNVSISVSNQSLEEATWDTAGETTKIGLDLGTLTNGTMVLLENDMLDKVQSVNVTTDVKLDLAATPNSLDTTVTAPVAVNINGLQGANKLTIAGSTQTGDAADIVNLNTLGDQFTGTVELTGKVTANMGAAANTAMKGATIVAMGDTVTLGGTLTGGELVVSQDSTANGDLQLANSDVKVVIAADSATLSNEQLEAPIADLDSMSMKSGAEGTVSIGTYDANGNFVESLAYNKYYTNVRIEGGKVLGDRNTSYYSDVLADKATSANGKAGLELADAALVNVNAQADKNSALGNAMDALDAMVATGNTGAADELGAALAGASTAVLGMAVSGDVDRQLRAIRNRTTTMGVDQGVVNPEMPYYNAWINAEGGNNELRHSGTQGGYKLNSRGGTVGFDVDFTPTFTAGMALTAMYGDLSVKGADQAKGDLDTYYVSAFARYCASAWTHTFVATAGLADMALSRTVAGSELEGDTNGMSFGLMYEAGRVFALNEDATACLQPILNVAWRHTTVDGYTEKGSDLGLKVDEQTYDSLTVGLGARLQTVVGESLYNRTSIFECRALVKAELGDHQGTSEVTLAGASAEVESAEMGSVGLEAGAGITIPLGDEGSSIFADASIEVYSGYTNVNGTVGYRVNF